jgi:OOP family OmpA-OmpF porin
MGRIIVGLAGMAAGGVLALSAPAAAQPVAELPCNAGPFMVFFDAGSASLSPQGKAILDNVAEAYGTCAQQPITIVGNTDTKGTDQANMALSGRMAASVRDYLVSRGLPAKLITIQALGETRLLIETDDEVSEPQNRRAEIVFGPVGRW